MAWWQQGLVSLAVTVLLAILFRLLAGKAARREPTTGAIIVEYGPLLRFCGGAFCLALFPALGILVLFAIPVPFVFTLFAMVAPLLFVCGLHIISTTIWVTEEGLTWFRPIRPPRELPWNEVTQVRYVPQWSFRFRGASRNHVDVPIYARGVSELLQECRKHVPYERTIKAQAGFEEFGIS